MGSSKVRHVNVRVLSATNADVLIEVREGRSVRELFSSNGEDSFRAIEAEVLVESLANPKGAVIAAAGGVVLRRENREALHASGARVVWLRADPVVLAERVKGGGHRPLLDADPEGMLRRMHEDREPLYREVADLIITVDGRSVNEVVEAVLR